MYELHGDPYRFVPVGEVVSCNLERISRAVLWIEFGTNYMRFGKHDGDKIVNMSGEVSEASLVAHEPMDIHK